MSLHLTSELELIFALLRLQDLEADQGGSRKRHSSPSLTPLLSGQFDYIGGDTEIVDGAVRLRVGKKKAGQEPMYRRFNHFRDTVWPALQDRL